MSYMLQKPSIAFPSLKLFAENSVYLFHSGENMIIIYISYKKVGEKMNEADVFQQLDLVRKISLNELGGITEEQGDFIPEGFRNNIRWNLGHIYTFQNSILSNHVGVDLDTPKYYEDLFSPGTKPADWKGDVPTLTEIIEKLTLQPGQIKAALSGKLDEPAIKPFIKQNNVGQILTFTFYHEGLHISTVKAFKALTNK